MKKSALLLCLLLLGALLSGCMFLPLLAPPADHNPPIEIYPPDTAEPMPTLSPEETPSTLPSKTGEPEKTPTPLNDIIQSIRESAGSITTAKPTPVVTSTPMITPTPAPTSSYTLEEAEYILPMNSPAPDFTLNDLNGNAVSLSDYRGKIVFLSFWQTWCGPCQAEMPYFEELMNENPDVVVLAVATLSGEGGSASQAERAIRDFISSNGYTFPVLIEPAANGGVTELSAYASQYIPVNLAIDKQGNIRYRQEGSYSEEGLPMLLDVMRGLDG